jgi:predicted permease
MRTFAAALESAIQDIRFGARLLWRSPGFTSVGVVSLGVGLGAGVALFTFMNALLFRPLPGRDTGNILAIFTSTSSGRPHGTSSFADFRSFVGSAPELFAGACATTNVTANIAAGGSPRAVPGALVNGGCFDALKIRPHLGRLLQPSDDSPAGESSGIVVSHTLWTRSFDAAPDIVGRGALLNGVSVVIVGVAEAGFAGLSLDSGAEFWAPAPLATALLSERTLTARNERQFRIYARLRDGISPSQAAARLSVVAGQLRAEDPRAWTDASGSPRAVTVLPELQSRFIGASPGATTEIFSGTLGAIGLIVLIACVNLATMIVARGAGRTRELNVRVALGASRFRLLRQLATESLLISIGGIVLGVLLVSAGLRLFDANRPSELPAFNLALDWRVALFSLAVAMLTPIFFGVIPGVHALRLAIAEGLKGRPVFLRRRFLRLGPRELLLFVQVAVSFALLVMAALFMRSLAITSTEPSGLSAIAVVPIDLSTAARSDQERRAATERLLRAATRVPDVEAPTAAALVPMTGSYLGVGARVDDRADGTRLGLDANIVAPGYFELAGIATRAGRTFEARDHDRAPRVAIVSESLARRLWNAATVVGRTVWLGEGPAEVIGVVADVPYRSMADPVQPVLYLPLAQAPRDRLVLHARVRSGSRGIADLDRALRAVDARVFVGAAMPLGEYLDQARIDARVAQGVGTVAGLLQLGLALMATWGLVAYAVERRTAEIAIRRALGATESSILHLVMRGSLWLLAAGAVVGCISGVVGAKVLYASFTGLAPLDLAVVAPAAAVLAAVVGLAAWLPARRVAAVEPASALKQS